MAIEGILSTLDSLAQTSTQGMNGISGGADAMSGAAAGGIDFGATLNRMMSAVESSNAQANQATIGMVDGSVDVHDAMIAIQRADMTFQLTTQIRNKLVNAYQDIMRMPI